MVNTGDCACSTPLKEGETVEDRLQKAADVFVHGSFRVGLDERVETAYLFFDMGTRVRLGVCMRLPVDVETLSLSLQLISLSSCCVSSLSCC
jgi:hypothetical protein